MERLTQKNDVFGYELPCQNAMGDTQAGEITIGDSEYTAKKYIIGEAIRRLGELEDVLERYKIENVEELDLILNKSENLLLNKSKNLLLANGVRFLKEKNNRLEQELAELKQKAIVPKFNYEQEIFFIDYNINQIVSATILSFDYYDKRYLARLKCFQEEQVWVYEEDIFATREEAEQKLAEIGGKDE